MKRFAHRLGVRDHVFQRQALSSITRERLPGNTEARMRISFVPPMHSPSAQQAAARLEPAGVTLRSARSTVAGGAHTPPVLKAQQPRRNTPAPRKPVAAQNYPWFIGSVRHLVREAPVRRERCATGVEHCSRTWPGQHCFVDSDADTSRACMCS